MAHILTRKEARQQAKRLTTDVVAGSQESVAALARLSYLYLRHQAESVIIADANVCLSTFAENCQKDCFIPTSSDMLSLQALSRLYIQQHTETAINADLLQQQNRQNDGVIPESPDMLTLQSLSRLYIQQHTETAINANVLHLENRQSDSFQLNTPGISSLQSLSRMYLQHQADATINAALIHTWQRDGFLLNTPGNSSLKSLSRMYLQHQADATINATLIHTWQKDGFLLNTPENFSLQSLSHMYIQQHADAAINATLQHTCEKNSFLPKTPEAFILQSLCHLYIQQHAVAAINATILHTPQSEIFTPKASSIWNVERLSRLYLQQQANVAIIKMLTQPGRQREMATLGRISQLYLLQQAEFCIQKQLEASFLQGPRFCVEDRMMGGLQLKVLRPTDKQKPEIAVESDTFITHKGPRFYVEDRMMGGLQLKVLHPSEKENTPKPVENTSVNINKGPRFYVEDRMMGGLQLKVLHPSEKENTLKPVENTHVNTNKARAPTPICEPASNIKPTTESLKTQEDGANETESTEDDAGLDCFVLDASEGCGDEALPPCPTTEENCSFEETVEELRRAIVKEISVDATTDAEAWVLERLLALPSTRATSDKASYRKALARKREVLALQAENSRLKSTREGLVKKNLWGGKRKTSADELVQLEALLEGAPEKFDAAGDDASTWLLDQLLNIASHLPLHRANEFRKALQSKKDMHAALRENSHLKAINETLTDLVSALSINRPKDPIAFAMGFVNAKGGISPKEIQDRMLKLFAQKTDDPDTEELQSVYEAKLEALAVQVLGRRHPEILPLLQKRAEVEILKAENKKLKKILETKQPSGSINYPQNFAEVELSPETKKESQGFGVSMIVHCYLNRQAEAACCAALLNEKTTEYFSQENEAATARIVQAFLKAQVQTASCTSLVARLKESKQREDKIASTAGVVQAFLHQQVVQACCNKLYKEVDRESRTLSIQTDFEFTVPEQAETPASPVLGPRFCVMDSLMGGLRLKVLRPPAQRALPTAAASSVFEFLANTLDETGPEKSFRIERRPVTAPPAAFAVGSNCITGRTQTWLKNVNATRKLEDKKLGLGIQQVHDREVKRLKEENEAGTKNILKVVFSNEAAEVFVDKIALSCLKTRLREQVCNDSDSIISDHLLRHLSAQLTTDILHEGMERSVFELLGRYESALKVASAFSGSVILEAVDAQVQNEIRYLKRKLISKRYAERYLSSLAAMFIETHSEELRVKDYLGMVDARGYILKHVMVQAERLKELERSSLSVSRLYLNEFSTRAVCNSRMHSVENMETQAHRQTAAQQKLISMVQSAAVPPIPYVHKGSECSSPQIVPDNSEMTMYPWEHPDNQDYSQWDFAALEEKTVVGLPQPPFDFPLPNGVKIDSPSTKAALSSRSGGSITTNEDDGSSYFGLESPATSSKGSQQRRKSTKDNQCNSRSNYGTPSILESPLRGLEFLADDDSEPTNSHRATASPPGGHVRHLLSLSQSRGSDKSCNSTPRGPELASTERSRGSSASYDLGSLQPLSLDSLPASKAQRQGELNPVKPLSRKNLLPSLNDDHESALAAAAANEKLKLQAAREAFAKTLALAKSAASLSVQLRETSLASFRHKGYGNADSKYVKYWDAKLQNSLQYYKDQTALNKAIGTLCKTGSLNATREGAFCALAEADGIVGVAHSHLLNPDFVKEIEVVCKIINVSKYFAILEDHRARGYGVSDSKLPDPKRYSRQNESLKKSGSSSPRGLRKDDAAVAADKTRAARQTQFPPVKHTSSASKKSSGLFPSSKDKKHAGASLSSKTKQRITKKDPTDLIGKMIEEEMFEQHPYSSKPFS